MAHTGLGHHLVGKLFDVAHIAFEHDGFHTVVMIKMHVQGGHGEVMMRVLCCG
jgi:hypothetical protein